MPSVSQKQANLMSAIKHGWHPPAGMHAPSMAVAKEFHAADKKAGKYMHAEGGKVSNLGRFMDLMAKYVPETEYGQNSHEYADLLHAHQWNPKVSKKDWDTYMHAKDVLATVMHPEVVTALKDLVDKYGMKLNKPVATFRGLSFLGDNSELLKPGAALRSELPQSTSLDEDVARVFTGYDKDALIKIHNPAGSKLLPQPLSGQSELLLPHGDEGALRVLGVGSDPIGGNTPLVTAIRKADGGQVDITNPQVQQDLLRARATPTPSKSENFLNLISHAADRATATVTDDPHHALARVASGLASQVAGQTRPGSGKVEFGRLPNLVDEIRSLPAGLTDLGMAGVNVLGGLSDKYFNTHMPGSLGDSLSRLRDAANAYVDKNGDPAPAWSRRAEADANATHQAVNRAMNLSAPKGFTENLADATGTMLGQLPIPGAEAKTVTRGAKAGLGALVKAIPEYLGPTIRPSLRNYATGALGGGALGALASPSEAQPLTQSPDSGIIGPKTRFEAAGGPVRMGKGGKVSTIVDAVKELLKQVADPASWEKLKELVVSHPDPAVHSVVQDHLLNLGTTPTSLHRPDFYMVENLSGALDNHRFEKTPESAQFLKETLDGAREQHLGTGKEPWPGYNQERAEYDGSQGIDELREVYGPEAGIDTGTKQ